MLQSMPKGHIPFLKGKEDGPFRCDHCEYYSDHSCNNKFIIGFAKKGLYGLKLVDGKAAVDPSDCSDYFEKK